MNPMKVLLVDDSKSARYALRLQLQRHGMTVETADAAETALERVRDTPPDAIFMDHTMPGMNGFEALDILKATPSTAHIPVVMCTSNEDPEFIAQAKKKGAIDILSKASAPEKLADLLDRLGRLEPVPTGISTASAGSVRAVPDDESRAQTAQKGAETPTEAWLEERIRVLAGQLVEERTQRLTHDLMTQTEERIELAESFAENLSAKTDERLASGLTKEAERLQQQVLEGQGEQLRTTTKRLLDDALPQAVGAQLEKEKQKIAEMVQELVGTSLSALIKEPSFARSFFDSVESRITNNAEQIVTREATKIASAVATERTGQIAGHIIQASRPGNGLNYLLAAGAALVGVASSVVVFFLLS